MSPVGDGIVEDRKSDGVGSSRTQNLVICISSVQFATQFYDPIAIGVPFICLDVGSAALGLALKILRQKVTDSELGVRIKRYRVLVLNQRSASHAVPKFSFGYGSKAGNFFIVHELWFGRVKERSAACVAIPVL